MKKIILFVLTATQLAGVTLALETGTPPHKAKAEVPVIATISSRSITVSQEDPRSNEQLFANEHISVSSIYPNPASTSASVKYRLLGGLREAKIVLCNVLGNVVGEYRLNKESKESKDLTELQITTSTLSSGVYFYTLSLDGRNVVTRKLIIRHPS
jgi:hypothetical protein